MQRRRNARHEKKNEKEDEKEERMPVGLTGRRNSHHENHVSHKDMFLYHIDDRSSIIVDEEKCLPPAFGTCVSKDVKCLSGHRMRRHAGCCKCQDDNPSNRWCRSVVQSSSSTEENRSGDMRVTIMIN